MRSEMFVNALIAIIAGMLLGAMCMACGDGPDLIDPTARKAPVVVTQGCDPPDAGADPCGPCPDAGPGEVCIRPLCGAGGFGE